MLIEKYADESRLIVSECFSNNGPLIKYSNKSKESIYELFTIFWPCFINNGLSAIAIDDPVGKVVGVFTGMDEALTDSKISICNKLWWDFKNKHFKWLNVLFKEMS